MIDRDRLTLHEQILYLIEENEDNAGLRAAVAHLARQRGATIYAELLYVLTSIEVQQHEAKALWDAAWEHTEKLAAQLDRPISITVGLHDYVTTVAPYLRRAKVVEVMRYEQMAHAAIRDGLTGLYNTGYIREQITWEAQKGKRYGTSGAILIFDLDFFKQCNDRYGHLAGDAVLRTFSACLLQQTRGTDVVGRYGGEEFVALLPSTNRIDALMVAERIRRAFETTPTLVPSGPSEGIWISTSGGITAYRGEDSTPEQPIEAADQALYLAKRDGKNRVYLDLMCRDTVLPVPMRLVRSSRPAASADIEQMKTIGRPQFKVATSVPITVDQMLDLDLRLPVSGETVTLGGQVISAKPARNGTSQVVVRIVERQPMDWLWVNRFLCQEEVARQRGTKRSLAGRPSRARH